MRELVRLAEVREGRARQSMADLLKSRSSLYEASTANTASEAAAQEAAATDASSERLSSAGNSSTSAPRLHPPCPMHAELLLGQ